MGRIVIVGASVAGVRAAEVLRNSGFDGELTVVDADPHQPYDKPPLSKQILAGVLTAEQIALRKPEALAALDLDLRTATRATALDTTAAVMHIEGPGRSEQLAYDGLIIATGSTARTVPAWSELEGVTTLRTLDESLALRESLDAAPARTVIIGAGFIGLELASAIRQRGLDVTVVEPLSAPVVRGLGEEMGQVVAALHRDHGVDLRLGIGVDSLHGGRKVERVVLSDGSEVDADLVVVGIGVFPSTGWLDGSGLTIADGVVTDEFLSAGVPGVYVAGDVARSPNPVLGEGTFRIEHWTNAHEQGELAARNLHAELFGGSPTAFSSVPYFWSDQHKRKIQFLGRAGADDHVEVVAGSVEERKFIALYRRDGRLVGALGMAMPKVLMGFRGLVEVRATWDDAIAHAQQQQG